MVLRKIHHYCRSIRFRAELFSEIARAARESIPLPHKLRRRVWKQPHQYDHYIRFLRFLDPRKRVQVFDVGANEGNWAADFLEFYPNTAMACLEPVPATFAKLSDRFKNDDRVRVINAAASVEAGTMEININTSSEQCSFHRYLPQEAGYKSDVLAKVPVQLIRLDSLACDEAAEARLMKMDVEGHEVEALKGAAKLLPNLDVVQLECSFNIAYAGKRPTFSAVCRLLEEADLFPIYFRPPGVSLSPYPWVGEVLFAQQRHLERLWGW